jgi:hypothetical protein
MDLPLLKNDITKILRHQKPVIYSRWTKLLRLHKMLMSVMAGLWAKGRSDK